MKNVEFITAPPNGLITADQIREIIRKTCPESDFKDKRVLLVVPDHTRTAPIGMMFKALHQELGKITRAFDVIIALGTHPPMSEEDIQARLEITAEQRKNEYRQVQFHNHAWNDPSALKLIGTIPASEIGSLTDGLFQMDVPVKINRIVYDYDHIVIVGPVFPHEVVGFSGGNKYLFPGISGAEILNFFHWLGAVITNAKIIGSKWTPVRKVVDRAGSMLSVSKKCFCLVVEEKRFVGLYAGSPEEAWDQASEHSRKINVEYKSKPFKKVLSCAPPMYDELWVGGKCMYKLEHVVADGGELIIYAPHIHEISLTHGEWIKKIGYHCRDYFLSQWEKFKDYPWGVLAHSTHVYGQGAYKNGVETPRIKVILATGISEKTCREINLGYKDPKSIKLDQYANREEEGNLLVPKAGERLFQLEQGQS
jgi:nickel-dependent lactate racemase